MRILILGTGTGVGKTFFTAALARALRRADPNSQVIALKPVETGFSRSSRLAAPPRGSDASLLESVSTAKPPRPHPLYLFRDPVSPHLAARRQRSTISPHGLAAWLRRSERTAIHGTTLHCWHLIEAAGGALSPVSARLTNAELFARLEPATSVLVAPDALGVLHDVRATLLALRAVARAPDFLVLSDARGEAARRGDASHGTNASELPRVGLPRPIAVLGRDDTEGTALAPLVDELVRAAHAARKTARGGQRRRTTSRAP